MQAMRVLELSKSRSLLMKNTGADSQNPSWDAAILQGDTGAEDRHAFGILCLFFFSGLGSQCISSSFSFVCSTALSQWEPSHHPEKD